MAQFRKKVIKVTLDATKTVVVACSSTTIDITNNTILSDGHGFKTGDVVGAITSVSLPTGLAVNTAYYVRVLSHDKFYLYDTYAHAIDLSATTGIIDLSATGSGNLTLRKNAIGVVYFKEILPKGAIISSFISNETTAYTSGGSATIRFGNGTETITDALAFDSDFSGVTAFVNGGDGTLAAKLDTLLTTVAAQLQVTIAVAALTDGVADIYIEYLN